MFLARCGGRITDIPAASGSHTKYAEVRHQLKLDAQQHEGDKLQTIRSWEINMEQILFNLIAGALGGVGAGKSSSTFDLGMIGNIVSGLIGGGVTTARGDFTFA